MPESLTQRWLRQNIAAYANQDILYTHVNAALAAHPTLRPKTDIYTYDDGRSQLLLCVHGLLPITFRRASYNIPISIWLTHQYPAEPPIVYVTPTSDMLVKASKHVQISGLCIPPYVEEWRRKSEGCSLATLGQVLIDQFSLEPPVYARPPSVQSQPTPPPRPIASATSQRRPTPPPRPPVAGPPPVTSPPPRSQSRLSGSQAHPSPPRLPPHPPSYVQPPVPSHAYNNTSVTNHSPAQAHIPQYAPPPTQWSSSLQSTSGQAVPQHIPHPAPPPPPLPHSLPAQVPITLSPPPLPKPTPNFLDEDVDSSSIPPPPMGAMPPPRPPNPEVLHLHARVYAKFTAEFANLQSTLAADMQRLQTTQSDLLAGEPAIRDEMARLEAVRDVCTVVRDRYKSTVESAEASLVELKKKGDPEVDELICSTTIVYNQLIELVAEDNAIEDTIYHLHRALNAGRIDLDKFLRTTRALAEEQFMKRALAEKIASSVPMGAWH